MKKILAIITVIYFFLATTNAPAVFAMAQPDFPSCVNPEGNVYSPTTYSSEHGIAGMPGAFTGNDTVYQNGNNFTQCFCPINGEGVQTNWWNVSGMEQSEIDSFVSQGWTYVPYGSTWGLPEGHYLAQNNNYQCVCITPTPGSTTSETSSTGSSSNSSSSNSSSSNSSSASSGSSPVQEVNALAFTGNIVFMYSLFGLGVVSLTAGLVLNRKKSAK